MNFYKMLLAFVAIGILGVTAIPLEGLETQTGESTEVSLSPPADNDRFTDPATSEIEAVENRVRFWSCLRRRDKDCPMNKDACVASCAKLVYGTRDDRCCPSDSLCKCFTKCSQEKDSGPCVHACNPGFPKPISPGPNATHTGDSNLAQQAMMQVSCQPGDHVCECLQVCPKGDTPCAKMCMRGASQPVSTIWPRPTIFPIPTVGCTSTVTVYTTHAPGTTTIYKPHTTYTTLSATDPAGEIASATTNGPAAFARDQSAASTTDDCDETAAVSTTGTSAPSATAATLSRRELIAESDVETSQDNSSSPDHDPDDDDDDDDFNDDGDGDGDDLDDDVVDDDDDVDDGDEGVVKRKENCNIFCRWCILQCGNNGECIKSCHHDYPSLLSDAVAESMVTVGADEAIDREANELNAGHDVNARGTTKPCNESCQACKFLCRPGPLGKQCRKQCRKRSPGLLAKSMAESEMVAESMAAVGADEAIDREANELNAGDDFDSRRESKPCTKACQACQLYCPKNLIGKDCREECRRRYPAAEGTRLCPSNDRLCECKNKCFDQSINYPGCIRDCMSHVLPRGADVSTEGSQHTDPPAEEVDESEDDVDGMANAQTSAVPPSLDGNFFRRHCHPNDACCICLKHCHVHCKRRCRHYCMPKDVPLEGPAVPELDG